MSDFLLLEHEFIFVFNNIYIYIFIKNCIQHLKRKKILTALENADKYNSVFKNSNALTTFLLPRPSPNSINSSSITR